MPPPSEQPPQVVVHNHGCGSGCGGAIAVMLVVGTIGLGAEWLAQNPVVAIALLLVAATAIGAYLGTRRQTAHRDGTVISAIGEQPCPQCGETVRSAAARCPRCGHRFF